MDQLFDMSAIIKPLGARLWSVLGGRRTGVGARRKALIFVSYIDDIYSSCSCRLLPVMCGAIRRKRVYRNAIAPGSTRSDNVKVVRLRLQDLWRIQIAVQAAIVIFAAAIAIYAAFTSSTASGPV